MASKAQEQPGSGGGGWRWFAGLVLVSVFVLVLIAEVWPRGQAPSSPQVSVLSTQSGYPMTIRTIDGDVVIPARPMRILPQTLFAAETLLAIGMSDRLAALPRIAVDPEYTNCLEQARALAKPVVESAESMVAIGPDLVIMASYSTAEIVAQVREGTRAPVLRMGEHNSLADIAANIRLLGRVVDEARACEVLIREMDQRIAAVQQRIPKDQPALTVLTYTAGGYTAGSGTLFDDVIRTAGARNLAAEQGIRWFGQIGPEQVVAWNPQVIISGASPWAVAQVEKNLRQDAALASTHALRNGRVFVVGYPLYSAASHHIAILVEKVAHMLYGPALEPGNHD